MHRLLLVAVLAACGHPASTATSAGPTTPSPTVMRLRPPPILDPDVRGSTYLGAVALQVQPGWGQFLDDCRLRLPASHPLNVFSLAATAEIAIDVKGQVVDVVIGTSGNSDFDRAVRDALRDANPLPVPPRELWSDDDRVHLRWLFARDRRQAGPATAQVVDVELPLEGVVERLVRARDLARAAKRIERAPRTDPMREKAMWQLAIASLRESLDSSDSSVRRDAVHAVRRAAVKELLPDVRALLTATSDIELRIVAMQAVTELGDDASAPVLLEQLQRDIAENGRLARAEMHALVGLHRERELASLLRAQLDKATRPNPLALEGVGLVAVPELSSQIGEWFARGDARTRAAACTALASAPVDAKQPRAWLLEGLGDRDASVRAACIGALHDANAVAAKKLLTRLLEDRDSLVRAAAVRQVVAFANAAKLARIPQDPSPEVRLAYATTVAANHPDLPQLTQDLDPDVRAAAWRTFVRSDHRSKQTLAQGAPADPAEQVRVAAVPAMVDDVVAKLARDDVAGEVRTAALVEIAGRRGRAAISDELLQRFADASPGSAERLRTMLAWLLAR